MSNTTDEKTNPEASCAPPSGSVIPCKQHTDHFYRGCQDCEREADAPDWKRHSEKLAKTLADVAGYLASVRLDRRKVVYGDEFTLQTVDWAEGAMELAEKANGALDTHDELISQNNHLQLSPSGGGSSQQNTPRPEGD